MRLDENAHVHTSTHPQPHTTQFAVFDGMKAISAAWVVFYHVLLWQIYFVQNPEVRM